MPNSTRRRDISWLAGSTVGFATLSVIAGGLLAVRIVRVGPSFGFLPWNLFLAWIPFMLALCVAVVHDRGGPRLLLWSLGAGWLLFLPNAPYILTDFVHLDGADGVPLWFDIGLIGIFAAIGLGLGLASLLIVHRVVQARAGRVAGWLVAVCSLGLSAVGIYLGRFPRFNSWDVLTNPGSLLAIMLYRLNHPFGNPFLLGFAALMSTVLLGSYLVVWLLGRRALGPVRGRPG